MAKKLKRIDIVKRGKRWVGARKGKKRVYAEASTKDVAVRRVARKAKRDPRDVSVRIHGRDGRIQEERTYRRTAHPVASRS